MSSTAFTCRRAAPSDVSAVRTLIEQQRLAGVRYSDIQHSDSDAGSSSGSSQQSSAESSRSSSAAHCLGHLHYHVSVRRPLRLQRLPPPLRVGRLRHQLSSVQLSGSLLSCQMAMAWCASHASSYQPNQQSLEGTAAARSTAGELASDGSSNSNSSTSTAARRARDWPTWLPHSLQCVSPSSAVVSSLHPSACRFVTFFACCSVANSRSERALVESA